MYNFFLLSGIAALVAASPAFTTTAKTTSTTKASATASSTCINYYSLEQLARFDNINDPVAAGVPDIPIDLYLDVYWNGMSLVTTTASGVGPGVVPQSAPNYAAFSPGDVATLLQGTPAMTTIYQDTTIDYLTLKSLYFGCALADQNGVVGVPVSCSITLTGFRNMQQVAQQTISFTGSALQQNMVPVTVNSNFQYVQTVTFVINGLNATTAAVIDNIDYIVYSHSNNFQKR